MTAGICLSQAKPMTEFSHCDPTDTAANAGLLLEYLQLLVNVMKSRTKPSRGE